MRRKGRGRGRCRGPGTCIGAATTRVLWLPALLVGVAVVAVGELRLRPRR